MRRVTRASGAKRSEAKAATSLPAGELKLLSVDGGERNQYVNLTFDGASGAVRLYSVGFGIKKDAMKVRGQIVVWLKSVTA